MRILYHLYRDRFFAFHSIVIDSSKCSLKSSSSFAHDSFSEETDITTKTMPGTRTIWYKIHNIILTSSPYPRYLSLAQTRNILSKPFPLLHQIIRRPFLRFINHSTFHRSSRYHGSSRHSRYLKDSPSVQSCSICMHSFDVIQFIRRGVHASRCVAFVLMWKGICWF